MIPSPGRVARLRSTAAVRAERRDHRGSGPVPEPSDDNMRRGYWLQRHAIAMDNSSFSYCRTPNTMLNLPQRSTGPFIGEMSVDMDKSLTRVSRSRQ
jgi:hypothetical protein